MRILHTADWHLGRTLEGRSRHEEQAQFVDELCRIVVDEHIDAVLLAGDAFDSVNPPAASEQLFYDAVSRLSDGGRRPVVVIAGNHDNPERLAASHPLAAGHGITLIGRPVAESVTVATAKGEGLRLAALPYPSESRLNEVLARSGDEDVLHEAYNERIKRLFADLAAGFTRDTVNIAMSHMFVAGGVETESERPIQIGGAYSVYTDAMPDAVQYVALGHLHRPQVIRDSRFPVRYSGSPLAYSFSEANQAKSVTIIDVEPGGKADVSEIVLSSGKPLVRWKAKEGLQQVHQWIDEGKDKHAWIDLELYVTDALSMEDIHRLRRSHSGLIHIHPVYPETAEDGERQVNTSLPIDELFEKFYRKQTGGGSPDASLTELFLELIGESDES